MTVCSGFLTFHIAVRMGCQSVECIKFYIGDVVLRGKNRWINWICIIAIRTTLEIIGSVAKTIFHTNWENSCSTAWMRRIYWHTILNDGQPKLRASGVVVPLVCEYPRDPEGIWGVFQLKLAISRGAVKHWYTVWPLLFVDTNVTNVEKFLPSSGIEPEAFCRCSNHWAMGLGQINRAVQLHCGMHCLLVTTWPGQSSQLDKTVNIMIHLCWEILYT